MKFDLSGSRLITCEACPRCPNTLTLTLTLTLTPTLPLPLTPTLALNPDPHPHPHPHPHQADKTIKFWKEDPDATPESHPLNWEPPRDRKRY